jgi:hypothetical protein
MLQASVVPALRKLREERGNRFVGNASEFKGPSRPSLSQSNALFRLSHYCTKSTYPCRCKNLK